MTCINQDTPRYTPLFVDRHDRLYGTGSKQYRVYVASPDANPLVQVQSTWEKQDDHFIPYFDRSAIIENLIIDGNQQEGIIGIELENVVNCQIRNVTIINCDVGIHLRSNYGFWSENNSLKHIRMINVKKGIVFTTTGPYSYYDPILQKNVTNPGDSAAFTTIDDVGIALANDDEAVGIQIGGTLITTGRPDVTTTPIKPYSSRIKANVWMGPAGGRGLKIINGELRYGLISLDVQGPASGIGVDLGSGAKKVYYNQLSTFNILDIVDERGFLLSCGGISNHVIPADFTPANDILIKTY